MAPYTRPKRSFCNASGGTGVESTWKFVIHVVVGAAQFLLILLIALILAWVVAYVDRLVFAPKWLVAGVAWVEQVVFWADVFAFGLFLVAEVLKLAAALWAEVKKAWAK